MKDNSYTSLEPTTLSGLGVAAPSFNGTSASFFATTSFIYSFFFIAIVMAAFYGYTLASIWRMQASPESISKSNDKFKKVTLGLLGSFGLILLILTVNKDLLTGDIGLGELRAKKGSEVVGTVRPSSPTTAPTPTTTAKPAGGGDYAARKASHEKVVARLAPSNINTNKNNVFCTEAQYSERKPSCTGLAYMPEETIQMLLKLNASCNCTVTITGGTEPGHITHGENKRAVDLRLGGPRGDPNNMDPLYTYIKRTASNKLGANSNCYEQYVLFSFTFCDEKPPNVQHFHVK